MCSFAWAVGKIGGNLVLKYQTRNNRKGHFLLMVPPDQSTPYVGGVFNSSGLLLVWDRVMRYWNPLEASKARGLN